MSVNVIQLVVSIDSAILASFLMSKSMILLKFLKEKDFQEVRSGSLIIWTMILVYFCVVFTMLLLTSLEGPSIAAAVLIIAKYQYQIAFVADQEINLLAALTEIMVECEFK